MVYVVSYYVEDRSSFNGTNSTNVKTSNGEARIIFSYNFLY